MTFQDELAYGCYFTYMIRPPSGSTRVNKIYGTNMQALRQFGVLDTAACQKSCCSSRWMTQHDPNARHQLVIPNTNDIPFLGSSSLLRKLAVVLDLPRQKARLGSLGCEVDSRIVNGHIALKIDCFQHVLTKCQRGKISQHSLMNHQPIWT